MKFHQIHIYSESTVAILNELNAHRRNASAYLEEASKTVLQDAMNTLHGGTIDEEFIRPLLEKPRTDRRGRRAKVTGEKLQELVDFLHDATAPINLEKTVLHKLVHLHLERALNEGIEKEVRRMLAKEFRR